MRVIDLNAAEATLKDLKARAEADPIPLEMIKALSQGQPPPPELNRNHSATIPHGVLVTYTIEVQAHGLMRHLSISVSGDKMPHPVVVEEMLKLLGYVNPMSLCKVWIEDVADGNKAINVIEPEDGDWSPYARARTPR